jgi:hypothetical protein
LSLKSTRIIMLSEEIIIQKFFFELFPFLKVAYIFTNQAIVESMEGEKMVHIIDLNAAEPAQWIALLQVFISEKRFWSKWAISFLKKLRN